MNTKVLLWSVGAAVVLAAIVASGLLGRQTACMDFHEGEIRFANQGMLSVALAETRDERVKGLGGCTFIPDRSGLYFVYEQAQPVEYWMKGMVIPIDIVWIAEGRVIGIEDHVPPPAGQVDEANLIRYRPPGPVTGVLEIAAGQAQELGIGLGDQVVLSR